jgi:hypothetical protein
MRDARRKGEREGFGEIGRKRDMSAHRTPAGSHLA